MSGKESRKAPGKAGRRVVGRADAVEASVDHLEQMGIDALRQLWGKRFRGDPPALGSADVLRRLMAWKIQIEAFGDLDDGTKARIRSLQRTERRVATDGTAVGPGIALRPGMVLVRAWHGVEHRVLVLDQGFEYRDKRYRSLTRIARTISGTRWSGPRFFGLEPSQLTRTLRAKTKA